MSDEEVQALKLTKTFDNSSVKRFCIFYLYILFQLPKFKYNLKSQTDIEISCLVSWEYDDKQVVIFNFTCPSILYLLNTDKYGGT